MTDPRPSGDVPPPIEPEPVAAGADAAVPPETPAAGDAPTVPDSASAMPDDATEPVRLDDADVAALMPAATEDAAVPAAPVETTIVAPTTPPPATPPVAPVTPAAVPVITTVPVAAPAPVVRGRSLSSTISRIVAFLFGILQALLILRIVLLLLVANQDNDIVAWVLNVTDPFVEPFRGMFSLDEVAGQQGSVLDIAAIVALIAWSLIETLILSVLRLFGRRT